MTGWIPVTAGLPDEMVAVDVWARPIESNAGTGPIPRRFADAVRSRGQWIRGDLLDARGNCPPLFGYTVTHWRKIPGRPRS